jgi:hypothetical protein
MRCGNRLKMTPRAGNWIKSALLAAGQQAETPRKACNVSTFCFGKRNSLAKWKNDVFR